MLFQPYNAWYTEELGEIRVQASPYYTLPINEKFAHDFRIKFKHCVCGEMLDNILHAIWSLSISQLSIVTQRFYINVISHSVIHWETAPSSPWWQESLTDWGDDQI